MTATAASRHTVPLAERAPATRGEAVAHAVLCCLLVVLWLAVVPASGGYFARTWYPATFATLVLAGVAGMALRRWLPPVRTSRVVLAALGTLVVLGWLSISWAGAPGDAWDAANKLVLLIAMGWVVALMPWTTRTLALVAGAWSLGVALYLAVRLGIWAGAADPSRFLDPGSLRFSDPLGYPNATAGLAAMAAVAALGLSSARTLPVVVRAAGLPVAVFLAEFAVLPQSRGAMVGVVAALIALMALSGERIGLVGRLAVAAALVGVAMPSLLAVGDAASDERPFTVLLDHAVTRIVVTVAFAALCGAALAALESRVVPSRRTERRFAVAVLVAVAVVGTMGLALYGGRVADLATSVWKPRTVENEGSRLFSTASEQRSDYARVSVDLFAEHPVAGVALGNFGREYDARRRHDKHSRYAHNLALRAISELGVLGLLVLLTVLGALAAGILNAWRARRGAERNVVAGCAAAAACFLAHAMLDWIEQFPALVLPALGLCLAVAGLAPPPTAARARRAGQSPWPGRLVAAGSVVMVAALLAVLVPPYLAVRYTDRATKEAATAPDAAIADLRRAADANPLAAEPIVAQGVLQEQLGLWPQARQTFFVALSREREWFSYLQIALLDAHAGNFHRAERRLAQARALSANDSVVADAARVIARRGEVDPLAVNERARGTSLFTRP